MNIKSLVKNTLIAVQNRKYEKALAARRMSYALWQKKQTGVQESAPSFLDDYVVFVCTEGRPAEDWQQQLATYLMRHPETLIVYGDEDVEVESGSYDMPYFKPDWSPDLLEQWNYVGGLVGIRRELLEKECKFDDIRKENGVQVLEPEALEQLIKHVTREAGGYEKRVQNLIGHIPAVLFHRKASWPVFRPEVQEDALSEIIGEAVEAWAQKEGHLLSVVIPSKDHPELLDNCLSALQRWEKELPYQVIVVDNGSCEENRQRCHNIFAGFRSRGMAITYLYQPMEFDFSHMCNLGAEQAEGDLLLFLNDDVELACENTLASMAQWALRPYVGAVGLKLYYPGGRRMQHCGITNLPMGPVHKLQFLEDDRDYYMGSNALNRNVLAVTAACLMVTGEKFWEAGGFPEDLKVAFNDVSLCFRLHELGYYNLVWNKQYAYHHESLSRGDDEADHKLRRLLQERETLYRLHPGLENKDPYYSEQLGREGLDTRIRPAYETACNEPQPIRIDGEWPDLDAYRQDACLMLRVEMSNSRQLLGYGVVLGDNNACYEKKLLLCKVDGMSLEQMGDLPRLVQKGGVQSYCVAIEGQYRPDLVENLPDQRNVGLSGFWLQVSEESMPGTAQKDCRIPGGTYRIGMLARNRVTGIKLMQFTNREWKIEY